MVELVLLIDSTRRQAMPRARACGDSAELHDGLPVGVRHVSDQHLTLLELSHLINAGEDVHLFRDKFGKPRREIILWGLNSNHPLASEL